MPTEKGSEGYWPELDGLRAIAVICVLFEHFLPASHILRQAGISWGEVGVQCFFVLSGFLITGILLECRDLHDRRGIGRGHLLRQFYIRRFLRIFPLFYATIAVCWLLDVGQMRATWPWHVTYLSNVGIVMADGSGFGHSFHFWTLAVEEQFYLLWPLLLLFAPRKYVPLIIVGSAALAPVFRVGMALGSDHWLARFLLTPACLDALAIGGWLAWLRRNPNISPETRRQWCRAGLILGLTTQGLLVSQVLPQQIASAVNVAGGRLALSGIFMFVIETAARGIAGWIGRLLRSAPMVYLGRISYGIYVLHHFMLEVPQDWQPRLVRESADGSVLKFVWLSLLTLAAAALSWRFYERPLNRFKSRFPYDG